MVAGLRGASTDVNLGAWCTVRRRRSTPPRRHSVSMVDGRVVPLRSFRDPNPPEPANGSAGDAPSAPLVPIDFLEFSLGAGGDVVAARSCAQTLLRDLSEPPRRLVGARLIVTAVCLHLYPVVGPVPTLADLHAFLVSLARPEASAWSAMADSPLALVQYASAEFNGGRGRQPQMALSLAIQSVMAKLHTNK